MPTRQPTKVKVPLYGNVNRAAFVEDGATVGARIGTNLQLPDGSVPTLAQLAAALGVGSSTTIVQGGPQATLWGLILEVPIYTSGTVSPTWIYRLDGVDVGQIGVAAVNDAIATGSLEGDLVFVPSGRALFTADLHVMMADADPDADVVLDLEATPSTPLVPVYVDSTTLGSMNPSITFVAHAIGTPAADRKIIVVFQAIQSGGADLDPSMTIGGVAATRILSQNGSVDSGGNGAHCSIFELDEPSGATANIVVTSAGDITFDSTINVYNLFGADPLFDSLSVGGAASASTTLDIDVPDGGAIIAGALQYDFIVPGFTWSGVTEDYEQTIYANDARGVASYAASATESPRAVSLAFTGTPGGNSSRAACIVSYGAAGSGPGRGRVGTTTLNEFAVVTDDVKRATFAEDGSDVVFDVDNFVITADLTLETYTGLVQAKGAAPATAIADSSTVGYVLTVTGPATYAWQPATGGSGGGGYPPQLGYAGI